MAIQPDGTNAALAAGQALELDQSPEFVRHRNGRSPRQQRLDKYWSWYTTDQYAARNVAWDGSKHVGQFERDAISIAGYVPPGFYVAQSQTLPIAFRRPTNPYHLARVVTDRFTSLVFSQHRHPKVTIDHDPDTNALVGAVNETGRLWPMMIQARTFGGATGTAVVGFKLLDGVPRFEVLDPRWCTPVWIDRPNMVLKALEYRYPYTQEVRVDGKWREVELWHRRVVDVDGDTVFEPELIDPEDPKEPRWKPATQVAHGFGFCPMVWIQNTPNATDIDGDPDCLGIYDTIEEIDQLRSQVGKALKANLDPTVVVCTDAEMGEVRKGSENAIKLLKGDTATYLEISAAGIKAAREEMEALREEALEVAQCVLDTPGTSPQTATEVDRRYASMLAKADVIREQYGELGVKRLVNMSIVAVNRISKPSVENGSIVRRTIYLPPRTHVDEDSGEMTLSEHKLGPGPYMASMQWPAYFEPTPADTQQAVGAAVVAKTGGLVDTETAIRYVAHHFGIDDVTHIAEKIAAEKSDTMAEESLAALRGIAGGGSGVLKAEAKQEGVGVAGDKK